MNKADIEKKQDYQSQFLAIAAAEELLLRATVRNPCHLQLMIGDQMAMQPISQQICDLLSALRISTSRNYDNKSQCREVVADLKRGVELDPHNLFIVGFDNITFKSVADTYGKTGMEHYTAFSGIKFSKEFLYKCNVYNDDHSKQLSREPEHDWDELCKKDKEDGGGE